MAFGEKIRVAREAAGIRLNAFARSVGVSAAYWSRIERELEKPPSNQLVEASANKLGLDRDGVYIAAGRLPPDIQANIGVAVRLYRRAHHVSG